MKLQPESKKQVKNIAAVTIALSAVMACVFVVLAVAGIWEGGPLKMLLSTAAGCVIAVGNFYLLCLTVQKAVETSQDQTRVKAIVQTSHNLRTLAQAAWCVVALVVDAINPVAAILPLIFAQVGVTYLARKEGAQAPTESPGDPSDQSDTQDQTTSQDA